MTQKTVAISMELWCDLIRYFLLESEDPDLYGRIEEGIDEKLDRMVLHELYTQYQTGDTEEKREAARREYLDRIGMHGDFRW